MDEIRANNHGQQFKVAILMATYQGERFLKEQLDSLFAQSYKDWTLYVHDDGSSDATMSILESYHSHYPNMVILDYPSQHGAKNNFFSMIERVDADYYFLCDQDDVWLPEKIETEIVQMMLLEKQHPNLPLLVCSDAFVVDEQLSIISSSLWRSSGKYPELLSTFSALGAIDYVTGCTMLFNRAVKNSIGVPSVWATMHDAWIALSVMKAGGIIFPISTPLMKYRQHSSNTLGAGEWKANQWNYRWRELIAVCQRHQQRWKMLQALNYGSLMKYIYYRIRYKYMRWVVYASSKDNQSLNNEEHENKTA